MDFGGGTGSWMDGWDIVEVGCHEAGFPAGVVELPDAPARLFRVGTPPPPGRPLVAVVGARAADVLALRAATDLARALVERGCVVVSGGAMGVDAAAHEAAVRAGGTTIGFFAGGLDLAGPRFHHPLYRRVLGAGGCFFSEQEPGTPPVRSRFPRRNRLLVAACRAVVAIQVRPGSGTMITARAALALGRPLLVVPGAWGDRSRFACVELQWKGADAVACVGHLHDRLDALGIGSRLPLLALAGHGPDPGSGPGPRVAHPTVAGGAGVAAARVLAALADGEPLGVDALVERTGLPCGAVMAALTSLEVAGKIATAGGGFYLPCAGEGDHPPGFPEKPGRPVGHRGRPVGEGGRGATLPAPVEPGMERSLDSLPFRA